MLEPRIERYEDESRDDGSTVLFDWRTQSIISDDEAALIVLGES